ncbi:MAG: PilZ domain-containing protein [Acidobacteria bacterium]|nr:PilZ domain-containing protein [Acidobacteriota bacterium]
MAMPEFHAPDRRAVPRKKVHLDCQVIFEGNEYDAVIQDISIMSAFLWSSFMPPHNSAVTLRLNPNFKKPPFILKGNVIRRDSKYRQHGKAGAFVITFSDNSPKLLQSLGNYINPQHRAT